MGICLLWTVNLLGHRSHRMRLSPEARSEWADIRGINLHYRKTAVHYFFLHGHKGQQPLRVQPGYEKQIWKAHSRLSDLLPQCHPGSCHLLGHAFLLIPQPVGIQLNCFYWLSQHSLVGSPLKGVLSICSCPLEPLGKMFIVPMQGPTFDNIEISRGPGQQCFMHPLIIICTPKRQFVLPRS